MHAETSQSRLIDLPLNKSQSLLLLKTRILHMLLLIPLVGNTIGWGIVTAMLIYPDYWKVAFTAGSLLGSLVPYCMYPLFVILATFFLKTAISLQSKKYLAVYVALEVLLALLCMSMALGFFFTANGLTRPIVVFVLLYQNLIDTSNILAIAWSWATVVVWTCICLIETVVWILSAVLIGVGLIPVFRMVNKGPVSIDT